MANESWRYKDLGDLRGKPARWDTEKEDWQPFTGMNQVELINQPEVLDVKDVDVKQELVKIKNTQDQIITALQSTNDNLLATNNNLNSVIKEDRLQSDTQLIGSIVADAFPVNSKGKYKLDTLLNSVTVSAGGNTGLVYPNPTDETEIYLFISIDVQPWELRWRNQFGSVSAMNSFPDYSNETKTYANNTPAISIPLGYRPYSQGFPSPSNLEEAKKWRLPLTPSEYFNIYNKSNSPATIKVDVLRVWR